MLGPENINVGHLETYGWGTGDQWLGPRKSMVGVHSGKPLVGAQETNGWDPGNQWRGPRQSLAGEQETMCWGSGKKLCCLLYTSPSPRDPKTSRMPSSA